MANMEELVMRVYGPVRGAMALARIRALMEPFTDNPVTSAFDFPDEKEIVLITYGDTLRRDHESPLRTLRDFAHSYLHEAVSTIHFLPFFPYSSDDGFSVIDFLEIDPALGTWEDVKAFAPEFRLMFDWVLNHVSAQSSWMKSYLASCPGYEQLAIEVDPHQNLSMVTRPRSLPLLTPFVKKDGRTVHLWTTFSADQVDLNFASVDVLVDMLRIMLSYVRNGADILRLDAVAYLWKTIGTPCIHLPQTHWLVKLFRAILDVIAPHVLLITETNVPHAENISYFGDAGDEAQLVYNFTLPPLLLHCFLDQEAAPLNRWAKTLFLPHRRTAFLNFTASHDGIGVRPLEGIIAAEDRQRLTAVATANGGDVSYKQNADGTQSPYELNITYVDALQGETAGGDELHVRRFLASQSIALVLPGVPAIYIHSLLGSRNWSDGVQLTRRARTINRERLNVAQVISEIENPGTFRSRIFSRFTAMLQVRRGQPAFHPKAEFRIFNLARQVFAIVRYGGGQKVLALTNISPDQVTVATGEAVAGATRDLLSDRIFSSGTVTLEPYAILWLTPV
jgi:glycosidase